MSDRILDERHFRLAGISVLTVISILAFPILADVRKEFTNENAPPEIHFKIFLSNFRADVDTDNPKLYALFRMRILQSMGIHEKDLDLVVSYFEALNKQIDSEIEESHQRIICPTHTPRAQGAELYPIFNELDEIRQAVHAKYLAIAAAEMSQKGYDHFREMLKKQGGGFTVIYSEHRTAWSSDPSRITLRAESICNALELKDYE